MKSRFISTAAATVGVILLTFGANAPASAAEPADPLAHVKAGYTQLGLSSTEADALLDKLASGKPLDSMTEGASPVRIDEYVQVGDAPYANDGDHVTVTWFADGSPAVTATETPVEVGGDATARSIQGCTYSSGSGYSSATGCTISGWWGTVQIAFLADYTLVQGGNDYISDTYNGWQQCVYPTSCSRPAEVQSNYSEGSSAAFSRWASTVTSPVASWEVWMQLNVGSDSANSTSS